jgi:predicted RNA binding protein YcfA (HicA-like mRNA interferase family)
MPSIKPIPTKLFIRIIEEEGFTFERQGKHKIYIKEGISRSLTIPHHKEVSKRVIQNNLKTAKISRERYFELLEKFK